MLKIIILFILKPQKVTSFWILGGEIRLDFSFKWILRTFCTALIYDIYELLRESGIYGSRSLLFGLSFLYSVDIIYFEEGMIWVKKSNTSA